MTNSIVQVKRDAVSTTDITITTITASCSAIAIMITLFRLWVRRGNIWWDDGWAAVSLLGLLCLLVGVFGQLSSAANNCITSTSFYVIVWSARLAILFSIIRITPYLHYRRYLMAAAALFFIFGAVLICQLFWICRDSFEGKGLMSRECAREFAISQLVADVISDTILLVVPLNLLKSLMDKHLRRRFILIFSTCVVTTIVSVVQAAFVFIDDRSGFLIAAIVEDCISLIVCNLPVVTTACIKAFQRPSELASPSPASGLRFAINLGSDVSEGNARSRVVVGIRGEHGHPGEVADSEVSLVSR